MTNNNRRICRECHVGRMRAYNTRTDRDAGIVVRYRRCGVCGANDRLVLDLAMLGRHVGPRVPKLVQSLPDYRANSASGGEYKCMSTPPIEGVDYDPDHNPLIRFQTVCARLRVSELDYRRAELRGQAPGPSPFGSYSWPGIVAWLEASCPVVDEELYGDAIRDDIVAEIDAMPPGEAAEHASLRARLLG